LSLSEKISTSIKMNVAKRKLESRKIDHRDGNPLEQWGVNKIKNEIKNNKELKQLFNPEELSRENIKDYKLIKFRELLNYVMENSSYYKDVFEKEGIDPSQIESYDDLAKIPLTNPEDLAAKPYHFLCIPRKKIVREFTSSGTTGIRKMIAYSQDEILEIVDAIISALKMLEMDSKDDTLHIMYPTITATWDPGVILGKACMLAGVKSVINDSESVEEQINTILESGSTHIIGLSSFVHKLSMEAKNIDGIKDIGIRKIICSSEPLTEEMRADIESVWGCEALRQWGMTELGLANAIECSQQNGFHVDNPDFLIEIVDPVTREILPPGVEGELVITTLRRKCMPLIRYSTRDFTSILDEPCKCGALLDQRITDIKRMPK